MHGMDWMDGCSGYGTQPCCLQQLFAGLGAELKADFFAKIQKKNRRIETRQRTMKQTIQPSKQATEENDGKLA